MAKPAKTTAKTQAKAPAATPARRGGAIRIRMYRLGVGDCFLLTLPRADGMPFRMLIDCGIHMAETQGAARIRAAVQDILKEAAGRIDVVVGTHEHWDHLSGFFHARDLFAAAAKPGKPLAGQIWCAWTEDADDPIARSLVSTRDQGVAALWGTMRRLHMAAADSPDAAQRAEDWAGIFGFFGDSPGTGVKAKAAAEAMRGLVGAPSDILYHRPGAPPFDAVSEDWRLFVLGPPRDPALLRRADPREGSGEAYPLAAAGMAAANLAAAVAEADDPPFAERYQIPLESSRALPFFREHYWADTAADGAQDGTPAAEAQDQGWRRLGLAWLDGAETLGLILDKITNNTSLVLALEIGPKTATDNPVILFAADAQVGNWRSWQDVACPDYHGRRVTGPDLLARTIIYKVGHHASHNATLKDGGLEAMKRLRLALIPTSAEMAGKVGWGTLPWPNLLDRLRVITQDRVLRSDLGASKGALALGAADGITVRDIADPANPALSAFEVTVALP